MPKVYSKRKSAPVEYRNPPPDAVLVDRTTDWGNPLSLEHAILDLEEKN